MHCRTAPHGPTVSLRSAGAVGSASLAITDPSDNVISERERDERLWQHCSGRRSLEVIDLSDNAINDASARPLCHTLASCRALSKAKRRTSRTSRGPITAIHRAVCAAVSMYIETADLRGCSAAPATCRALACLLDSVPLWCRRLT